MPLPNSRIALGRRHSPRLALCAAVFVLAWTLDAPPLHAGVRVVSGVNSGVREEEAAEVQAKTPEQPAEFGTGGKVAVEFGTGQAEFGAGQGQHVFDAPDLTQMSRDSLSDVGEFGGVAQAGLAAPAVPFGAPSRVPAPQRAEQPLPFPN